MRVVGIHEVMNNILVRPGILGKKSNPAKDDYVDIRRVIAAAFELRGRLISDSRLWCSRGWCWA